jgi:endonuclease/exonuclease/phosphatase family metal-dependent hydrolase
MKVSGRILFGRIMFGLNLVALLGLLLSYLALFVSPEHFWMLAFMGLGYPVFLIINLFFFFYWLVIQWKKALFSGILLLAGIYKINDLYHFGKPTDRDTILSYRAADSSLHIMSYNVRLFDLYNWTNNKLTRNKIMDVIRKEQADILCFQEFFYDDTNEFNTLDTLLEIQPARYKHVAHTATVKKVNHWGIATLSRYPIINKGIIPFKDSTDNISIFSDIKAYGDTFRIYNLHLESVRFRKGDYEALKTITGNEDNTDLEGPQRIIERMRRAYIRRARQTDVISEHIAQSPHPVVICGDFNDTPNSYTYHQISKGLNDAFREAGSGVGTTYIGMIPFLRIDYILYSKDRFEPLYFKVIRKKLSDHYPVVSTLKLKDPKKKESTED